MLDLTDPTLLRTQARIDGKGADADDGATQPVIDPATGGTVAEVARCGTAETRRSIEAAEAAGPAWAATPAKERARLLRRWFDLMIEHQKDLARILTAEQGKPLA